MPSLLSLKLNSQGKSYYQQNSTDQTSTVTQTITYYFLTPLGPRLEIGPSGCVHCHGNKVYTINGVIFHSHSLSLSAGLLFSQKGLS